MADAVRIFISYAHEDESLRERLRVNLSQLERDGLVKGWDDRELPAGGQWADEIDQRLESADIILLLVSADFIHSEFCYGKEMKRAIERHKAKDDRARDARGDGDRVEEETGCEGDVLRDAEPSEEDHEGRLA